MTAIHSLSKLRGVATARQKHTNDHPRRSWLSSTSERGTRDFFAWLEDRFGGDLSSSSLMLPKGKKDDDDGDDGDATAYAGAVVVADRLHTIDLKRLFGNEIAVLQVPNFYPRSSARELGRELARQALDQQNHQQKHQQLQNWKVGTARGLESSDVFTLGAHLPYNVASGRGTREALDDYYANVPKEFQQRRRETGDARSDDERDGGNNDDAAKRIWPLDQLRLELDEVWPHGATLARRRDGSARSSSSSTTTPTTQTSTCTMGGGLPRIMMGPTRWAKGFVHVDEMAPLSKSSGLFSANIYLQLPPDKDTGVLSTSPSSSLSSLMPQPVLEIWPLQITNRWDWYRNAQTLSYLSSQDAEGQVLLRKALGTPIRVSVQPGDLVLISTQRPHCAIGFQTQGAVRVSLQTFLQFNGQDKQLEVEG